MNLLEVPEDFPALPMRTLTEREFLMWRYPSFEANSSWSIFRTKNSGEYFLRRLELNPRDRPQGSIPLPDVFGAESPLPAKTVRRILSAFESLRIPAFRQSPVSIVLDGTTCGVQFGNRLQATRIHWWSHHSEEWTPLVSLFDQTIETFDRTLPASTLRTHGR